MIRRVWILPFWNALSIAQGRLTYVTVESSWDSTDFLCLRSVVLYLFWSTCFYKFDNDELLLWCAPFAFPEEFNLSDSSQG